MMTWSDRPFGAVTPLSQVNAPGAVIAEQRAECEVIYEIDAFPGWLAKIYRPGFPREGTRTLDRLIELPQRMTDSDRSLVDRCTAWPVSRIIDAQRPVGVIMAKAPEQFFAGITAMSGRIRRMALELDHLVQLDPFYAPRGLSAPSLEGRLRVTRQLVAVGDLLERHHVVYGDWSYANAFWSQDTGDAFVIDMDACGFDSRHWVQTNQWEDPLNNHTPGNARVDVHTDRYKLAMLVVRCLTGVRGDPCMALADLPSTLRNDQIGRLVDASLTAAERTRRPRAAELLRALDSITGAAPAPTPDSGVDWMSTLRPGSGVTGAVDVRHIRAAARSANTPGGRLGAAAKTGSRPTAGPRTSPTKPTDPTAPPRRTAPTGPGTGSPSSPRNSSQSDQSRQSPSSRLHDMPGGSSGGSDGFDVFVVLFWLFWSVVIVGVAYLIFQR